MIDRAEETTLNLALKGGFPKEEPLEQDVLDKVNCKFKVLVHWEVEEQEGGWTD